MTFERESIRVLQNAVERLDAGFDALPPLHQDAQDVRIASVITEVAERLRDNFPYQHPLYAGQMLKPPHPVARIAYALAQWVNPNNHALDGGRASSAMEKEAVAELAKMFGWTEHLGHLTGGGTMANLEALWVAGQILPEKKILASAQAHYTHQRISAVLGLPFETVPVDVRGRMDVNALKERLAKGDVGTVVATIGTTAIGAVDPLPEILNVCRANGVRVHADAAYGGYFVLADTLSHETRSAYDRLRDVDSLVIDPHKHGLQPYGCGCVIFRDGRAGKYYKHDSPYTYFSSMELHLGEISLECSRPGAAAVALWATQRLFPLIRGGEFAVMLEKGRKAALALHARLAEDKRFIPAATPDLDIVVWVPRAQTLAESSRLSRVIFEECARENLHLAVAQLPARLFGLGGDAHSADATITALRSVLMKPEHLEWLDAIWKVLDRTTNKVLQSASHSTVL
jgi:tyrosine decarboxylase / aspartate 1-decarboxylase